MSQTIYNEFTALGVSLVRVLNDLRVTGPDSILADETYLTKLRANKASLLAYIQSLEDDERTKNQGLGDTVSKAIKKMTGGKIEECDSCKKRKEMLNKLFPYTDSTIDGGEL